MLGSEYFVLERSMSASTHVRMRSKEAGASATRPDQHKSLHDNHPLCNTPKVLWRLRRARRLRAGHIRLGRRLLRPADIPSRGDRTHGLAVDLGLYSRDAALSVRRRRHRQSAALVRSRGRACHHRLRGSGNSSRCVRLGHRVAPLAALRCGAVQRDGMGGDGCRDSQRGGLTMARSDSPNGAGQGLQRCQHWRRDLLATVGGADCALRLRNGRRRSGCGHGLGHGVAGPQRVRQDARGHGATPGWGHHFTQGSCRPCRRTQTSARRIAMARSSFPNAGDRNGRRAVRADWSAGASVLASGSSPGRANGGPGDGCGHCVRHPRPYRCGAPPVAHT